MGNWVSNSRNTMNEPISQSDSCSHEQHATLMHRFITTIVLIHLIELVNFLLLSIIVGNQFQNFCAARIKTRNKPFHLSINCVWETCVTKHNCNFIHRANFRIEGSLLYSFISSASIIVQKVVFTIEAIFFNSMQEGNNSNNEEPQFYTQCCLL